MATLEVTVEALNDDGSVWRSVTGVKMRVTGLIPLKVVNIETVDFGTFDEADQRQSPREVRVSDKGGEIGIAPNPTIQTMRRGDRFVVLPGELHIEGRPVY